MKKWKLSDVVLFFSLLLAGVALVLFEVLKIRIYEDETLNSLFSDTALRVLLMPLLISFMFSFKETECLKFHKNTLKAMLWCLPFLLVAFANFPYSSLINGTAQVDRFDLLPLFILYTLSVSLLEEFVFRGVLQSLLAYRLKDKPHAFVKTVLITAAIFALSHLANLFVGGGVPSTMLQVGYTFLTGAMFSMIVAYTKNIWFAVIVHWLFDIGGLLVGKIGSGASWDSVFWILTVVCGVIAFCYALLTLKFSVYGQGKDHEQTL